MPWRRLASGMLTEQGGAKVRDGLVQSSRRTCADGCQPGNACSRTAGSARLRTGGSKSFIPRSTRFRPENRRRCARSIDLPASIGQRLFATLAHKALAGARRADQGRAAGSVAHGAARFPGRCATCTNRPPTRTARRSSAATSPAHLALAFDEMFAFQLALCLERERAARAFRYRTGTRGSRHFAMARRAAVHADRARSRARSRKSAPTWCGASQMNRMLMGDVGSGKTIVAFWAALRAVECGMAGGNHGADRAARRAALSQLHGACAADWGARRRLLTARADGASARGPLRCARSNRGRCRLCSARTRLSRSGVQIRRLGLARDRRAASLRRFRSRAPEGARRRGQRAADDGDADSAKPCAHACSRISRFLFSTSCRPDARPIATEIFAETRSRSSEANRARGAARRKSRATMCFR